MQKSKTVIKQVGTRKEEVLKKRYLAKKRKRVLFLCIIIFLLSSSIVVTHLNMFKIKTVLTEGFKIENEKDAHERVIELLNGSYFFLYPKNNIFIYPKDTIISQVQKVYPRLEDITIHRNSFSKITLSVKERVPVYLWCGNDYTISIDQTNCYFTDATGYVFSQAPKFSAPVYFTFYTPINFDIPITHYVANKDLITKIISIKNKLTVLGIKVYTVSVKEDNELVFTLNKAGYTGGQELRFDTKDDLDLAMVNLQTALDAEPLLSGKTNNFESFLYIDTRYDNKVFYKLRNE